MNEHHVEQLHWTSIQQPNMVCFNQECIALNLCHLRPIGSNGSLSSWDFSGSVDSVASKISSKSSSDYNRTQDNW